VLSVAFSPDGRRIVTTSEDETARIWDAATARTIALLQGHTGKVWSAAFSPDGERIVTASDDKTARIWDAATAKELAQLQGHTVRMLSAAFSPDGQRVVTGSDDNVARIWDVSRSMTGRPATLLIASLASGVGWRNEAERADLLMKDAPDDLYAEACRQFGRAANDPEIAEIAARLRAPRHSNCYLSPTQFTEKFGRPTVAAALAAATAAMKKTIASEVVEETPAAGANENVAEPTTVKPPTLAPGGTDATPAAAKPTTERVSTALRSSSEPALASTGAPRARRPWVLWLLLTWALAATAALASVVALWR
jgi:dipeptidyl aminopeptidase/acylaminoacyl peptidase